jgi:hypothetical protein
MSATRINHVSVHARDLGESVAFYTDLAGVHPQSEDNQRARLYVGDSRPAVGSPAA